MEQLYLKARKKNQTTLFPNSESCHSPGLGIQEVEKNEEEQVVVGDQE